MKDDDLIMLKYISKLKIFFNLFLNGEDFDLKEFFSEKKNK